MNEELNKRTVFVVDDDRSILEVVKGSMERNYLVQCFTTPLEVLNMGSGVLSAVDLYIIDVRIQTKRNGIDLAASISEVNKYAPFLLISGYDPPVKEITSMPLTNVTDFLAKPFDSFSLLNRSKILIMAADAMRNLSAESCRLREEWRKIIRDHSAMIKAVREGKTSAIEDFDW